jgi:hypothetical protein
LPELTQTDVDEARRFWHRAFVARRIEQGGSPYAPSYEAYPAGAERGARAVIAALTELGAIRRTGPNEYTVYTPAGRVAMTSAELSINTQED